MGASQRLRCCSFVSSENSKCPARVWSSSRNLVPAQPHLHSVPQIPSCYRIMLLAPSLPSRPEPHPLPLSLSSLLQKPHLGASPPFLLPKGLVHRPLIPARAASPPCSCLSLPSSLQRLPLRPKSSSFNCLPCLLTCPSRLHVYRLHVYSGFLGSDQPFQQL